MADGPLLWFLNRGSGLVLVVLMTLTVLLGVLAAQGRAGRGLPGFVSQQLHRNVSLLSLAMLGVHVTSAVLDTYVDIRWWQALVPWGGTYQPVWLGLGALALDLMAVLVITSLLRTRIPEKLWRGLHLLSYLSWGVSVLHGLGIGTDAATPWSLWITVGCVAAVLAAFVARLVRRFVGASVGEPA